MNHNIAFDRVEAGRALGHDLRRWIGIARSHWPPPLREGFDAARAAGVAPKSADRYVRKWLQLRESAWRRERVMADDVTPDLLRQIDVLRCPITRVLLTHGELGGSDWSIDRINNDGAYAANNLAVLSVRVNRIKGARSFEDVFVHTRSDAGGEGLSRAEWQRLAAVMLGPCFALQQRPHRSCRLRRRSQAIRCGPPTSRSSTCSRAVRAPSRARTSSSKLSRQPAPANGR